MIARLRNMGFLHHGAQANYGTCYQMKWMNIKLGNYKVSGTGMNRCGICVQWLLSFPLIN